MSLLIALVCGPIFTIMVGIADRLGTFLKVPAHRFAGPVAFSCAPGIVVLVALLMMLGLV